MFDLSIPVTLENLEAIKAESYSTLPNVKSMHRTEAIARGFGFNSYAALRAQLANPQKRRASGAAFSTYLNEHGFVVEPIAFYRAVVRVAMRAVMAEVLKLSVYGIGIGEPRYLGDGKWESRREQRIKFDKDRASLLSDYSVEPFLLSLALVQRIPSTKTVRPRTGSYRLKHIAENYECDWPEGGSLGPQYVANGLLIAAAVHAGFSIKTYVDESGWDYPNVNFNMSKSVIEDLDCETRPDGGAAQDRKRKEEWRAMIARYGRHRPAKRSFVSFA